MRPVYLFFFILVFSCFAGIHEETIIKTSWNFESPSGKEIAIKNTDLVLAHDYYSGVHRYQYLVNVYLWVRRDLYAGERLINVINVMQPEMNPDFILKTGFDYNATKYFIYKASFVMKENSSHEFAFYASVLLMEENQRIFYSNEGKPDELFEFEFEI